MVTIRNPNEARARTVVAGEALENGMFVKLVQGAVKGDPPKVMKITSKAEMNDATLIKGVVMYIPDNDLTTDFVMTNLDPQYPANVLNTGADSAHKIPLGANCVLWMDKPIFGFHKLALDAGAAAGFDSIREGDKVAVHVDSAKLTLHDGADVKRDVYVGTVYQHEGAEITVLLQAF